MRCAAEIEAEDAGGTAEFGIEDVSAMCKTHLVDVDEAVCGRPCADIDAFTGFCSAIMTYRCIFYWQ